MSHQDTEMGQAKLLKLPIKLKAKKVRMHYMAFLKKCLLLTLKMVYGMTL